MDGSLFQCCGIIKSYSVFGLETFSFIVPNVVDWERLPVQALNLFNSFRSSAWFRIKFTSWWWVHFDLTASVLAGSALKPSTLI